MLKVNDLYSYESETDNFLIDAVKSGDNDAFGVLVDRYSAIINYNLSWFPWRIFRFSSWFYNTDRDDLFQECCIIFFKAVKHYDLNFDVKFSTYANACIKNYLISLYRKCTRTSGYAVVSLDDGCVARSLKLDCGADTYESSEVAEILDSKILSALTNFESKVFTLYLQGQSYKNIANILDKNVKSIDNAICRIKSKFRHSGTVKYN